jgi:hypothetical protein
MLLRPLVSPSAFAFLSLALSCATAVYADSFGSGSNSFDIEFVRIGNPGNAADTTGSPNPVGSVAYPYRMGKFEISEQMIQKANVLGKLGITKDTRGVNKPATSVSWNEAARFVNWLNTSSGSAPAYKFTTQPGEIGYNENADIELWDCNDAGYNPHNLYRNRLARYFLPSVDEWYKAAYYDPGAGVYYDYPTGSNSVPDGIDFAGDTTFDAVFFDADHSFGPQPHDITDVGLLSPFGTAGQGGNAWEFGETELDLVNDSSSYPRVTRGGGFIGSDSHGLLSSVRDGKFPSVWNLDVGFRVASIPEPSTALLGTLATVGLWLRRKR